VLRPSTKRGERGGGREKTRTIAGEKMGMEGSERKLDAFNRGEATQKRRDADRSRDEFHANDRAERGRE